MASEYSIPVLAALVPIVLGLLSQVCRISHSTFQRLALTCISGEIGTLFYIGTASETDPILIHLAAAAVISTGCAVLGQQISNCSSTVLGSGLVVLGLSLAALLGETPVNRYALIGILGYAAFSCFRLDRSTTIRTISLIQMALVIVLVSVSSFVEDSLYERAGLFLAVTLVPLPPFHLPFVSLVGSTHGILAGVWTVVFLSLGFAQLHELQGFIPEATRSALPLLALVGTLYASLKCLGQNRVRLLIAYATIAQISLLWGLTDVFSTFSEWGIPFGITVALVTNGLFVAYAFVQERYGSHDVGNLPGLATPMPRLGTLLILLISLAVLLPIVPTFAGLTTMPTTENQDGSLMIISLILFSVWMFGSWYFSHLLHQTAFGKARPDVPYTDLRTTEVCSLAVIIFCASVSAFVH